MFLPLSCLLFPCELSYCVCLCVCPSLFNWPLHAGLLLHVCSFLFPFYLYLAGWLFASYISPLPWLLVHCKKAYCWVCLAPSPGFLSLSRVFSPSPGYLPHVALLIAALSLADLLIASCVSSLPRQLVPCCRIATPSLGFLSHADWLIAAFVSPFPLASSPFRVCFSFSWLLATWVGLLIIALSLADLLIASYVSPISRLLIPCRLAYCSPLSWLLIPYLQAGLLLHMFRPFPGYLLIGGLLLFKACSAPSLGYLFIEGWLIARFCASLFPGLLLNGRSVPYLGMEQ